MPVFPLPSPLRLSLFLSPLFRPIVQIVRDLVVGREDVVGIVPSSLESREEGTVSDFVSVLGPVLVVFLCRSSGGTLQDDRE